jgi:lipoprotein-releasing system permease protein
MVFALNNQPESPMKPHSFRLSLFIALRYLLSKHSLNFISVITTISICGITIGVAALIVVMSLFNGFQALIERFLIGFDPHIRITAVVADGTSSLPVWLNATDSLETRIKQALKPLTPQSVYVAPVASGKVICVSASGSTGVNTATTLKAFQLVGMEESSIDRISGVAQTLVVGQFALESDTPSVVNLVMGASLADNLRITCGDTVQLLAPAAIEAAITQGTPPRPVRALVVGIFQSNNKEYDAAQSYTSLASARRLLRMPAGTSQSVDIRLPSSAQSVEAQRILQGVLPATMRVETWFDLHRDLYTVMRFERLAAFCVLFIIVLVAVFNIFASLSMSVSEKRAEIGMLKAMGAPPHLIVRIFFGQSLIIGVIGTLLGVVLGVGLCWAQMRFGFFALDSNRYVIQILPLLVEWRDVVLISVVSIALSLLAGWVPARKAGDVRSAIALLRKERV